MVNYLVATIKDWNIKWFHSRTPEFPGTWYLIDRPEDLTLDALKKISPRYVFFPHWSWKVAEDILEYVDCVCFHMTDVPYGRGRGALQNLILRGHENTVVSALRMGSKMDAGPVYLKRPLSLEGRAQEIYERASDIVYEMMLEIVETEPKPLPQSGKPTVFSARKPEQSRMPSHGTLAELHDHIRMLDAVTYPRSFLEHDDFRLEFSHAELSEDGILRARVEITPCPSKEK